MQMHIRILLAVSGSVLLYQAQPEETGHLQPGAIPGRGIPV